MCGLWSTDLYQLSCRSFNYTEEEDKQIVIYIPDSDGPYSIVTPGYSCVKDATCNRRAHLIPT